MSERDRRVEAAARAIGAELDSGYRGHYCAEWWEDDGCERCREIATKALRAAEEA